MHSSYVNKYCSYHHRNRTELLFNHTDFYLLSLNLPLVENYNNWSISAGGNIVRLKSNGRVINFISSNKIERVWGLKSRRIWNVVRARSKIEFVEARTKPVNRTFVIDSYYSHSGTPVIPFAPCVSRDLQLISLWNFIYPWWSSDVNKFSDFDLVFLYNIKIKWQDH